jgi:hypothetical protein
VVFFSTTPCERLNSRTRSVLLTVNSIVSFPPLAFPGQIAPGLFYCCFLVPEQATF